MSFIDLMGNDVWSEEDIINRTESLLYGAFSREREQILNRKMVGFSLGRLIPSLEEQAELTEYEIAAYLAQQEGIAARADMARLQGALDYEGRVLRLSQPEVPQFIDGWDGDGAPVQTENPAYATDQSERQAAQAAIDAAGEAVLELAAQRAAARTPSEPQANTSPEETIAPEEA